ncbi:MLO-like protein 4 [Tanacetum coccineum]
MVEILIREGRSLAETPTWAVATTITFMVFACLLVQRSIYRFGRWLKKTRRKALLASLEKIKEELMLLGLISLLLGQWARVISQICVDSSLFSSKFFQCSKEDYESGKFSVFTRFSSFSNESDIPPEGLHAQPHHQCGEGREPFVSYEGLEQLHRFLFVLGITHVLYSCITVGLAMGKIYSWRKWEYQASVLAAENLQGLNIYFWISFVPAILALLVGTKLQHVVSLLALEIVAPRGPTVAGTQVKPHKYQDNFTYIFNS